MGKLESVEGGRWPRRDFAEANRRQIALICAAGPARSKVGRRAARRSPIPLSFRARIMRAELRPGPLLTSAVAEGLENWPAFFFKGRRRRIVGKICLPSASFGWAHRGEGGVAKWRSAACVCARSGKQQPLPFHGVGTQKGAAAAPAPEQPAPLPRGRPIRPRPLRELEGGRH